MQLIGRLFDYVLARKGERVTIVGATSGDTGSAAIEACRDREAIDIFILYPRRACLLEVQRRQMTTVPASNVYCVAVEVTFDDCQDLVKAMFAEAAFRETVRSSAVNSINWARVAAQIVYYFHAALSVGSPDRPVSFSVPTGNFNVFVAYAQSLWLADRPTIIGTNSNDILTRFFATGELSIGKVSQTISPSMDIQVSSNFERFLFDLYGRDGSALTEAMAAFRRDGTLTVGDNLHRNAAKTVSAYRLDDEETMVEMARTLHHDGRTDRSAYGNRLAAARQCRRGDATWCHRPGSRSSCEVPDAVEKRPGYDRNCRRTSAICMTARNASPCWLITLKPSKTLSAKISPSGSYMSVQVLCLRTACGLSRNRCRVWRRFPVVCGLAAVPGTNRRKSMVSRICWNTWRSKARNGGMRRILSRKSSRSAVI